MKLTDIDREYPLRDWNQSQFSRDVNAAAHLDDEYAAENARWLEQYERDRQAQEAKADAEYRNAHPIATTARRARR